MNRHEFSLVPFRDAPLPDIAITGSILREGSRLGLQYLLTGHIEEIYFPERAQTPVRRDDLWRTTCFELFLAIPGLPGYWEFNWSPSGDWNIYSMEAYRRVGFREERRVPAPVLDSRLVAESFTLDASFSLDAIFRETQSLEAGIAAVIQTRDGHESYWALAHPGTLADFHARQSFILALAGAALPAKLPAPGD